MNFYFENTKKIITMKEEDKEDFENKNICRFCDKEVFFDSVRDHCHLTGSYRGPPHNNCNFVLKQKQSNFVPFKFHNFRIYSCHLFFKRLTNLKNDKMEIKMITITNEEYNSMRYGCIRFIDSYRFLSASLHRLVKNLDSDEFNIFKKRFPDKRKFLNIKLACPYKYFNGIDDYKKPVDNLKKNTPSVN